MNGNLTIYATAIRPRQNFYSTYEDGTLDICSPLFQGTLHRKFEFEF